MINVYVIKNSNFYGKPIFYENDSALKKAMQDMLDELKNQEDSQQLRDYVLNSLIYKIGEFDPVAGKIKSCFGKRFVGCLADLLKGV